jgi:CRP/FNR family transcriptional regulator, cyclic AMP receptor protein
VKYPGKTGLSLRDAPFFRDFDEALVERLEGFVYLREYEARQIVYFPDDQCDQVYWVRRGRVRVTRVSDDGRELTFRHLQAGDLFGEECLVGRPRREEYAEALVPGTLCIMRSDDFRRLMAAEPALALRVAEGLCRRTLEVEQVLSEAVFQSVRSRVAAGLLRLYRKEAQGPGTALNVTHQEIANLIGSTRETTTATLHALRSEGMVELANRRLTILDPDALEHAARSG